MTSKLKCSRLVVTQANHQPTRYDLLADCVHFLKRCQSIGLLSQIIVEVENHPLPPKLLRNSSSFGTLKCAATYGPSFPDEIRQLVYDAKDDDSEFGMMKLQDKLLKLHPNYASELGTTQAVDVIQGGIKSNALPDVAFAVVNHRIAEHRYVF